MPIVIDRKTGKTISRPQYTQEQIDRLWEAVINAYIDHCPEKILEMLQDGSK